MRINICTSDVYPGDAIGNFSLQLQELLTRCGFDVRLFARHYASSVKPRLFDLDLLESLTEPDDLIFAQYSIYESFNDTYWRLSNKKIVYYHGITPSHYFNELDPETEKNCADGIAQAPAFRDFDFYLANSGFMLQELMDRIWVDRAGAPDMHVKAAIVPPIIDLESRFSSVDLSAPRQAAGELGKYILYVGRVAPHKKIEDLIAWFRGYLELDPKISLVIVGGDAPQAYGSRLRYLIETDEALAGRVIFEGHVHDARLCDLYRSAEAFVTLSEHEGFCVPLVEAMGLGIPVFARAAAAIPETLGRHDLLLADQGLRVFAHQVYEVLADATMRSTLVQRQNAFYAELVSRSSGETLISLLRSVLE